MGILNFILEIGILGSSMFSLLLFVTGNLGTSLFMERNRKLLLTKFRVRCPHCHVRGRLPHLVHFPFFWFPLSFEYKLVLTLFFLQWKLVKDWGDDIRNEFKLLWTSLLVSRIMTSLWILNLYTTIVWDLNLQPMSIGCFLGQSGVSFRLYNLTSSFPYEWPILFCRRPLASARIGMLVPRRRRISICRRFLHLPWRSRSWG